jgi:hypothetical protein
LDEVLRASEALGVTPKPERVFALLSGGRRYVLVAAPPVISENELDYMESSLGDLGRLV